MKTGIIISFLIISFAISGCSSAQNAKEPWSENQLMEPSALAGILNKDAGRDLYIFSIGPSAVIKNSRDIGPASEKKNLEKFRKTLSTLPKNADLVIYCGCCPFRDCPNIRPAFSLLNEMKFTNHKLLDLSQNIRVDWINKGYPINK